MSSRPALNTATVVSPKGDRTTGSPLLDSFVLTQKADSTAYLSQGIAKKITATETSPDSSLRIMLGSLPVALSSASRQVKSPESHRPEKAAIASPNKQDSMHPEKLVKEIVRDVSESTVSESDLALEDGAEARAKTTDIETFRQKLSSETPYIEPLPSESKAVEPLPLESNVAKPLPPAPEVVKPKVVASRVADSLPQRPRKRLPNPSLERAAAVGMLDLSDKLLFGGEDDALISAFLGEDDLLAPEGDEATVFKYLSKQIVESSLTKIQSRLPLSVQPESKTEPSEAVLDAKNFKVIKETAETAGDSRLQAVSEEVEGKAEQSDEQMLDAASMSQQIARLNQKVESLSRELLSLSATASQRSQSGSGEAA